MKEHECENVQFSNIFDWMKYYDEFDHKSKEGYCMIYGTDYDGFNEYIEITYCPFCGEMLSKLTYKKCLEIFANKVDEHCIKLVHQWVKEDKITHELMEKLVVEIVDKYGVL